MNDDLRDLLRSGRDLEGDLLVSGEARKSLQLTRANDSLNRHLIWRDSQWAKRVHVNEFPQLFANVADQLITISHVDLDGPMKIKIRSGLLENSPPPVEPTEDEVKLGQQVELFITLTRDAIEAAEPDVADVCRRLNSLTAKVKAWDRLRLEDSWSVAKVRRYVTQNFARPDFIPEAIWNQINDDLHQFDKGAEV